MATQSVWAGFVLSRTGPSFLSFCCCCCCFCQKYRKINAIGEHLSCWDFPQTMSCCLLFSHVSVGLWVDKKLDMSSPSETGSFWPPWSTFHKTWLSWQLWELHPTGLCYIRKADTSAKIPEIFTPRAHLICLLHTPYPATIFQASLHTQKAVFGWISSHCSVLHNNRTKAVGDHYKWLKFQSPFAHLIFP